MPLERVLKGQNFNNPGLQPRDDKQNRNAFHLPTSSGELTNYET
jgi:hypothetical protein